MSIILDFGSKVHKSYILFYFLKVRLYINVLEYSILLSHDDDSKKQDTFKNICTMCGSVWFYFPFIPSLTDTTNLYSIFVQKTHCIGIASLGKMKNINNRNTHDRTLNCMKKTES